MEAGGPTQTAILNNVKIIRGSKKGGKTFIVDIEEFLKTGDESLLLPIYPGDTIDIPGININRTGASSGTGPATAGGITNTQVSEGTIYVYGEVLRPGGYQFNKNMNLLEAT